MLTNLTVSVSTLYWGGWVLETTNWVPCVHDKVPLMLGGAMPLLNKIKHWVPYVNWRNFGTGTVENTVWDMRWSVTEVVRNSISTLIWLVLCILWCKFYIQLIKCFQWFLPLLNKIKHWVPYVNWRNFGTGTVENTVWDMRWSVTEVVRNSISTLIWLVLCILWCKFYIQLIKCFQWFLYAEFFIWEVYQYHYYRNIKKYNCQHQAIKMYRQQVYLFTGTCLLMQIFYLLKII